MKRKSFTLIEATVSVMIIILLAVAFTPNLNKRQEQTELDRAVDLITNAVQETRSLAISPTETTNKGRVMQAWILIFNISNSAREYCFHVEGQVNSTSSCANLYTDGYVVPAKSYIILAAEDTNPNFPRKVVKKPIALPKDISVIFDFPCHGNPTTQCNSGVGGESYFWKPHFRHMDGAIGFDGKYYNYPDLSDTNSTGYWLPQPSIWGNNASSSNGTPSYSHFVVVSGHVASPESTYPEDGSTDSTKNCVSGTFKNMKCKIINIDNINGAVTVL